MGDWLPKESLMSERVPRMSLVREVETKEMVWRVGAVIEGRERSWFEGEEWRRREDSVKEINWTMMGRRRED